MRFNLVSAALLYGVLSTTIVVAEDGGRAPPPISTPATPVILTSTGPDGSVSVVTVTGLGNKDNIPTDPALGSVTSSPVLSGSGGSGSDASSGTNVPKSTGKNDDAVAASSPKPSVGKSNNTGAIAGGVVGGVLFLVLVGALIFFLRKRKKARDPFGSMEKSSESSSTLSQSLIAY